MMARNLYNGTSGTELKGKKLGIHAFGQVGRNVARIAKGFGMEVFAFDPYCPASVMEAEGVKPITDINELYSTCQYVSLHIPATNETKKSINYALMKQMPKGDMIINTARKEVILHLIMHLCSQKNLQDAISSLRRKWVLKQPKPTSTQESPQQNNR